MLIRGGCVYILTNQNHSVLYTGVTSNLRGRVWDHKHKSYPRSFTAKYNCSKLIYYNFFPTIQEAIAEEKRIKAGSRMAKIKLIDGINPQWRDLYQDI
jgi:putative endonuclease